MAESAISFLLNNFSTWLQYHQNLLEGLGPEVENIFNEIGHMRAFLRAVDSKEQDDPQLKEWMRQVREIAYDVEDALDVYKLQVANHGRNGFSSRVKRIYGSIKGVRSRHQIASQIQAIKSRVENASRSYQRYKDVYPYMDQGETCYDSRGDALLLEDVDVVGIGNPKEQLLKWIESPYWELKVISVVGMAGMGKTTLVKKVYDDKSVKDNFDYHVWITVSESYKAENLLERMMKLLVDEGKQPMPHPWGMGMMNLNEMREFIYNFLQFKTYIIVLDDVWRRDAFEAIRYAFPRNSQGYIIVTTRFNNIANAIGFDNDRYVHDLAPLSVEDSELLFYKKAFPRSSCPLHLEEISKIILKRCEGLPLAIVVIGGLLATKNNNIQEWEMFNRSIGDELQGDNLGRMKKLISLSFYDLPYYLKSCFLYMSILPKDKLLKTLRLVRLLTAEGFVQEKNGKTMEEVAEGYLNELVNRSLIQVVDMLPDGRPTSFHIHDLFRECIISGSIHDTFVASNEGAIGWNAKIRRIALDGLRGLHDNIHNYSFEHLRSLLLSGLEDAPNEVILLILRKILRTRSKLLKVLDLRRARLASIPDELFKLYHLKYLNLRGTKVEHISKSIKNLTNLETLDLSYTRVTKLPAGVVKLKKLRHLLVGSFRYGRNYFVFEIPRGFHGPKDIGLLSSLQTLVYLHADDAKTVIEIGKLTQLRTLGLTMLKRKDGNDLCSSISKLHNLQALYLCSFRDEVIDLHHPLATSSFPSLQRLVLHGCLEKMPHWTPILVGLTALHLTASRLRDQDPLEHIQGLPNLLILEMDFAYEGEELIFKAGGFARLKRLNLMRFTNLKRMKVEEGCMPCLEELGVWDCQSMDEVPEGLQHLLQLQCVDFIDMSNEFVVSITQKREGKGWELGHVLKVDVYSCWREFGLKERDCDELE